MNHAQLLQWHLDAGVDEVIGDEPVNRLLAAPPAATYELPPVQALAPAPVAKSFGAPLAAASEAVAKARALADNCTTLAELETAIRGFDAIGIKKTAMNTVIYDGNPKANILIVGEAPGAQEDQQGIPFCGPSGQLMDKMLAAIGLSRETVCITNTVYWRPPGNRTPSVDEIAICQPFVQKFIALTAPKLLFLFGGIATGAILGKDTSISRLRLKTYDYTNPYINEPVAVAVTFHPSYLLRTPSQKRLAWQDLQFTHAWLESNNLI
jgi:DNA polymerase